MVRLLKVTLLIWGLSSMWHYFSPNNSWEFMFTVCTKTSLPIINVEFYDFQKIKTNEFCFFPFTHPSCLPQVLPNSWCSKMALNIRKSKIKRIHTLRCCTWKGQRSPSAEPPKNCGPPHPHTKTPISTGTGSFLTPASRLTAGLVPWHPLVSDVWVGVCSETRQTWSCAFQQIYSVKVLWINRKTVYSELQTLKM